jgi:hypothetical protein
MGDEEAVMELVAAAEELTRRLEENNHFARTAVQLAELSTHPQREQLRSRRRHSSTTGACTYTCQ